ncbi:Circadian clock protein kinase KaiC [uncultured archaeon]|nr:Circadian clock protein kinase KaiC [uncultured archaeon]
MGFLEKLKSAESEKATISKISKVKQLPEKIKTPKENINLDALAEAVAARINKRTPEEHNIISEKIKEQREPIQEKIQKIKKSPTLKSEEWVKTGIPGLDNLFEKGIPQGTSVLVAGGAGSGKTIMCLQMLNHAAVNNQRALYISLEETEFRLKKHMHDFGWNPEDLEKKGFLKIVKIKPFAIARQVEALLIKEKGELNINIEELGELIPKNFKPEFVVVDSLTALASAFRDGENSYRIYIEQLFEYLEKLGATSFLISETEQIPTRFSKTGVEEFLADGVIVLYNVKHGNLKENAIEVLKLRGAKHEKKIVAMQILPEGIVVYPEQEIFSDF